MEGGERRLTERQLNRTPARSDLGTDDTGCHILHVDMDAFFAAVEIRDRPELAGLPVVVGRSHGRGVVVSASYEARALGVHSAMPTGQAHRVAPNAIYVEPSRGKYTKASAEVMELLRQLTPVVEVVSVDEAFLDVRGSQRSMGSPAAIARTIRSRVSQEIGLTCSVGVAPVTLVAKMASTQSKPDGLLVVPKASMIDYLHSMPVGKLWGVGTRTEHQLATIGIATVGDLAAMPLHRLQRSVGKAAGQRLSELASGHEPRPVQDRGQEKSIGSEVTFDVDTTDSALIERELRSACEGVGRRLRSSGLVARQVTLKVRFEDFTTITRSHTLAEPNDVAGPIFAAVRGLWVKARELRRPVRLVGVRVEQLAEVGKTGHQLSLDAHDSQWAAAESAVDQVAAKFGSGAVVPARMLTLDPS